MEKLLKYDKNTGDNAFINTGEVRKWHVQPYNKVDKIAAYHEICYDIGKNKGECDNKIIIDEIPYVEMSKWDRTTRFLVNGKQKLGLGL